MCLFSYNVNVISTKVLIEDTVCLLLETGPPFFAVIWATRISSRLQGKPSFLSYFSIWVYSVGQALYRLSYYQVKKLACCKKKSSPDNGPVDMSVRWSWIFKIQYIKLSFIGDLKVKCLIFLMIWKFCWMLLGRRKRKIRGRHEGEEGNSRSQNSHGNNCSYYYLLPKVTKTKARKICTTLHLWASSFYILIFLSILDEREWTPSKRRSKQRPWNTSQESRIW